MMREELSEVVNQMGELLDKYSEIREVISDEVLQQDVVVALGDCSKIGQGLIKLHKIGSEIMFRAFLKGFNIHGEPEEIKIDRLKEYVTGKKKAMFITQTLQNIVLAKSQKATTILGYMLNDLIDKKEQLNDKYIILANCLPYMFDHDIDNVKYIGDYCNYKINDNRKANSTTTKRNIYFGKKFKEQILRCGIDSEIMFLTLEKCVTHQVLLKEVEASTELNIDLDVMYDKNRDDEPDVSATGSSADTYVDESYRMTGVGDILYQIINILEI